jgi:hypothetical protein
MARANFNSQASEVRRALANHVAGVRAGKVPVVGHGRENARARRTLSGAVGPDAARDKDAP